MGKITVHGLLTCLLENLFKNYVSEIYIQDLLLSNFQSFAHNLLTDDVERNISFFLSIHFVALQSSTYIDVLMLLDLSLDSLGGGYYCSF